MNHAIRSTAAALGVLLELSGVNHGFFEVLQGNQPTPGLVILAIGPQMQMWAYGGEEAFTLLPNFLLTGLLALAVGALIVIWSLCYLDTARGPLVLGLLLVLLFLVGGGIGQVLAFPLILVLATRINKPLDGWRKLLPAGARPFLARLWPWVLDTAVILFLAGLFIAITGYVPSLSDPEQIINIDWTILLLGLLGFVLAYVTAAARDIETQPAWPEVAVARG